MRCIAALSLLAATAVAAQAPREAESVAAQRYARVVITSHDLNEQSKPEIIVDARGHLRATAVTLRHLIVKAFGVRPQRVAGGPAWVGTDQFDLVAVPEEGVERVDANAMVRLLEDRFHLQVRWEPHRMPVYLLKRQKGSTAGRGIRPPSAGCEHTPRTAGPSACDSAVGWNGPGWLFVRRGRVSSLAAFLPSELEREVLDETGLKGTYDIDLKFAPGPNSDAPFAEARGAELPPRPDIVTALREQLGFALEPSVAELPVQWIASVERPELD
jgi:uncharacterized protein (TIGR03435 family)